MKNPQKLSRAQCMKNLYRVLNVQSSATRGEIKAAYERAKKNFIQPSSNTNAREIEEAWAILSSNELRAEYDAFIQMGGMKWSLKRKKDLLDLAVPGSFGSKK